MLDILDEELEQNENLLRSFDDIGSAVVEVEIVVLGACLKSLGWRNRSNVGGVSVERWCRGVDIGERLQSRRGGGCCMGHEDDVSMTSSMQLPIPAIPIPCEDEATDSCSLSSPAPDRSGDVVNPESVLDDVEAAPLSPVPTVEHLPQKLARSEEEEAESLL